MQPKKQNTSINTKNRKKKKTKKLRYCKEGEFRRTENGKWFIVKNGEFVPYQIPATA